MLQIAISNGSPENPMAVKAAKGFQSVSAEAVAADRSGDAV